MERTILHCDCNGFFASVEMAFHPELKHVPMAVGGSEEDRHGIILAKNELAKKYNIQTAETIVEAKRKCPDLVIVPPRHEEYSKFSKRVNEIYRQYTDLVEPFGIDESWLDVTGSKRLFGDGKTIADEIRHRVKEEIGITVSVGVSFNKVFAKLGSDYKKPDATTVISKENYQKIVYPLSVKDLLFVGKKTLLQLEAMQIRTIGDLAQADRDLLSKRLGKMGNILSVYARGEDNEPVKSIYAEDETKSIGNGMTFRRDLTGEEDVKKGIHLLSESIATRMRKKHLKCETVHIQVKSPEFQVVSKQKKLPAPTNSAREIATAAYELFVKLWNLRSPVRAITVTGTNLVPEDVGIQLNLFAPPEVDEKQERLLETIDELREKFGADSLTTADFIDSDLGKHPKEKEET